MMDKTHEVPTTTCPKCGVLVDMATNTEGVAAPGADDFSICFTCATICRYNDDMTLREASRADLNLIKNDQPEDFKTLLHVQTEIKRFRLSKTKEN